MTDELHVVAFNVPWPADYGGVMDVYYRLRALSEAGVKLYLHCFTYGRSQAPELKSLCASVDYYRRDMSWRLQMGRRPFIVSSRDNADLRRRLLGDDVPVLLEGVHCCSLLEEGALQPGRRVAVRAHNVETDYYSMLSRSETDFLRRGYLKLEALKLRRYEPILRRASAVFTVSDADGDHFRAMGCRRVATVPCGNPNRGPVERPAADAVRQALYHGNLAVAENDAAAKELITNIFDGLECRLVVAGHAPSASLQALANRHDNVTLVADPSDREMQKLVAESQVNILTTNQATGLKIKLLNALFNGRHCLVNSSMVEGTGLAGLCTVEDSPEGMRQAVMRLMDEDFAPAQTVARQRLLQPFVTANAIRPMLDWLAEA